jgi:taurine transport system permease protein
VIILWWGAARLEVVPAMFLPSPQAVVAKFFAISSEGFEGATLLQHLLASLGRVLAALVGAVAAGVILGFAVNLNRTARGVIEPLLEFYRPIPPLAYLPLVIIWFGIGEFAKILVIFLGILPSIIIATNDGLRSVSQDRVNAALALGATRFQVVALVLFPHALPNILTGTRIGLGTGWATLVAAELVAATRGLGFMIKGAADFLVTDVVILGILVIAAVAIVMEFGLRWLQRVVVPWQGHD